MLVSVVHYGSGVAFSVVYFFLGLAALAFLYRTAKFYVQRVERFQAKTDINVDKISRYITYLAALGGLVGAIVALSTAIREGGLVEFIQKLLPPAAYAPERNGWLHLIQPAYGNDGAAGNNLTPIIPYIAGGILAVMGIAFLTALVTLLWLPDNKENQARIKAADNIVKTFGGFFTGMATTLLK